MDRAVSGMLGAGDSYLVENVIPEQGSCGDQASCDSESLFHSLLQEVCFEQMQHRGGAVPRLIAVQGIIYSSSQLVSLLSKGVRVGHAALTGTDVDHDSQPQQRQEARGFGELPSAFADTHYDWEPIYRHPTDDDLPLSPMSATVLRIKHQIESILGPPPDREFNHVLIQLYRNGSDNISEHSDKTLDIARGSDIINFSVGASRTLYLKPKKDAESRFTERQRVVLRNNSCFVCGPETNRYFLHGIKADKRLEREKRDDELSFGGQRISLTFRTIRTFRTYRVQRALPPASSRISASDVGQQLLRDDADREATVGVTKCSIFGQGGKCKSFEDWSATETGGRVDETDDEDEATQARKLLESFSIENRTAHYDWDQIYGRGFNITRISCD
jgi:2OG-Fe(II) oxygenase superfamily